MERKTNRANKPWYLPTGGNWLFTCNHSSPQLFHYRKLFTFLVLTIMLTIIHHGYGAYLYEDSFRLHVVFFAIPILIVLPLCYRAMVVTRNGSVRITSLIVFLFLAAFSTIGIGLYEGGYNHLLKNILYFTGVPVTTLDDLYPSIYELPNDFIFELTGIMQFVTGVGCLAHARGIDFRKLITS